MPNKAPRLKITEPGSPEDEKEMRRAFESYFKEVKKLMPEVEGLFSKKAMITLFDAGWGEGKKSLLKQIFKSVAKKGASK